MKCRPGCGACCVEASIAEAIPGMPDGKPGGVRCVNLDSANRCTIWNKNGYPEACRNFTPNMEFCGISNEEAYRLIAEWERTTIPKGYSRAVSGRYIP